MSFTRTTTRKPRPGVPVYDEAGALLADSVSAAARLLGCTPHNLHLNHLEEHRDGVRLASRPSPRRVGRRAIPVYDESGALFAESVTRAAERLGCHYVSLYPHMTYDEALGGHRLTSRPDPANAGRKGGARKRRRAA